LSKTVLATAADAAQRTGGGLAAKIGVAKVESDNYVVEATAGGPYTATREGTFHVQLTAKGAYHLNPQFPIRFKAAEAPEFITYSKPVLTRDDGNFKESTGSFDVPFSASKPGGYKVGGTVSVSFCSEKNCVMEKVAIDLDVTVK
jgi:hypothetical protein